MAVLLGDSSKPPLMDPTMSASMRRRVTELWGLGFAVLAIGIGLALWSYDIGDPSPFSATTLPANNWLGEPGAMVADTFIRHFGLGSWALVLFLSAWAVRFLFHIGEERIWARLIPALPFIALAPAFASTHAVYDSWPLSGAGLGGSLGDSSARVLLDSVPLPDVPGLQVLGLGLGLIMVVIGGMALGFTLGEVRAIAGWLGRSLGQVGGAVFRRSAKLSARGATAAREKVREIRARPRSETMEPAEPTGSWRAKLPKMPTLSGLAGMAGRTRATDEPELDLGRVTGTDDHLQESRMAYAEPATEEAEQHESPAQETEQPALRAAFSRLSNEDARSVSPPPESYEPVAEADDDFAPARPPIERTRKKPQPSRRAEAERQPTLGLDPNTAQTFEPPAFALLQKPVNVVRAHASDMALEENARMLETVLEDYGVRGEIVAVRPGPVVTLYELEPAPGLKASRVIGLADDIARSMSALAARVSTVPGRSVIGIELPNTEREKVWLREVFEGRDYGDARFPLALALGKDISGAPVVSNLAKMPHLLIAGTTGSGKSVAINTMILSLLYRLTPQQCRLIMIDPKMLELSVYDNIPHLLAPVVTDPKKAIVALKWVVAEMEERYRKMSKMGVRNIDGYNACVRDALEKGEEFSRTVQTGFDDDTGEPVYETEVFEPQEMPYIVVIVDEMADLMMVAGKEIEACIQRLAQMARASGIHLIMATQRPSVDVITGTIKANFPTRISFQVTSKIDSRTILGEQGAEQLLGMGDMLFMEGGGRIQRVHGPFVSDEEVEEVVRYLKSQGMPDYVNAVTDGVDDEAGRAVDEKLGLAPTGSSEDELYDHAVAIVARDRKCSTSYIQRKLAIGYNKAARLVEQMEDQGVVTSANAVGKREILVEER